MKLEVGRRYMTQFGRVAFVAYYNEDTETYSVAVEGDPYRSLYNETGERVDCSKGGSVEWEYRLISCLDNREKELEGEIDEIGRKIYEAMNMLMIYAKDE